MNPSTAVATAIVDALVDGGVREVVLCPGSRSSAMAYAVAAAERAGRLRLHVRVDERSAGFLALGLAKVSRRPAVVVTTSGTAVANLHPAVLEAHHARVPLIVLSTDRPAELRGTGANQTTLQPGMFGPVLRGEADLAPETSPMDLVGHVTDAVAAASGVLGGATVRNVAVGAGPVHLNVQFREPLVPDLADDSPSHNVRRLDAAEATTLSDAARGRADATGEGTVLPARTMVVLGDLPVLEQSRAVLAWAQRVGLPVLAEPFGAHPRPGVVAHGVLVAGVERVLEEDEPEAIVVVGRPTLSRPFTAMLRRPGPRLIVADAGLEFAVPGRESEPFDLDDLLVSTVATADVDASSGWCEQWITLGHRVAHAIDADPPAWPTGPAVARALVAALPEGALVFLGSSNTPRDLDVAATIKQSVDLVASRGLAGIDGCVSTAIGLALSAPDRPTYAVLGDLTFLHDSGGLLIGPDEPRPDLTIVVINDDGGGIFTTLEPGAPERSADFERLFGTPTGTDLEALCRAHGIRHEKASTATELAAAIATRPDGIRVIEVTIDRSTHRGERERLRALAEWALG